MSWTTEKVEKLKELWGKGNTASQIADNENDGLPTEDKVAEIFEAIKPLFPTPHKIIFD